MPQLVLKCFMSCNLQGLSKEALDRTFCHAHVYFCQLRKYLISLAIKQVIVFLIGNNSVLFDLVVENVRVDSLRSLFSIIKFVNRILD